MPEKTDRLLRCPNHKVMSDIQTMCHLKLKRHFFLLSPVREHRVLSAECEGRGGDEKQRRHQEEAQEPKSAFGIK